MGSINNNVEGIYYLDDFLVTSSSFLVECGASVLNYCPEPNYWSWFDDFSFESLKRFEFGLRLKFIINDLSINAPQVLANIPDQYPVVGHIDVI